MDDGPPESDDDTRLLHDLFQTVHGPSSIESVKYFFTKALPSARHAQKPQYDSRLLLPITCGCFRSAVRDFSRSCSANLARSPSGRVNNFFNISSAAVTIETSPSPLLQLNSLPLNSLRQFRKSQMMILVFSTTFIKTVHRLSSVVHRLIS